jgi:hypothetical protein
MFGLEVTLTFFFGEIHIKKHKKHVFLILKILFIFKNNYNLKKKTITSPKTPTGIQQEYN